MPSLKIIGLPVLEKILKAFTNGIYERGGHLDHVIWTVYTNFERRLHIILALFGQAVSEIFENVGRTLTDDDDNFGFSKGKK